MLLLLLFLLLVKKLKKKKKMKKKKKERVSDLGIPRKTSVRKSWITWTQWKTSLIN